MFKTQLLTPTQSLLCSCYYTYDDYCLMDFYQAAPSRTDNLGKRHTTGTFMHSLECHNSLYNSFAAFQNRKASGAYLGKGGAMPPLFFYFALQ